MVFRSPTTIQRKRKKKLNKRKGKEIKRKIRVLDIKNISNCFNEIEYDFFL